LSSRPRLALARPRRFRSGSTQLVDPDRCGRAVSARRRCSPVANQRRGPGAGQWHRSREGEITARQQPQPAFRSGPKRATVLGDGECHSRLITMTRLCPQRPPDRPAATPRVDAGRWWGLGSFVQESCASAGPAPSESWRLVSSRWRPARAAQSTLSCPRRPRTRPPVPGQHHGRAHWSSRPGRLQRRGSAVGQSTPAVRRRCCRVGAVQHQGQHRGAAFDP